MDTYPFTIVRSSKAQLSTREENGSMSSAMMDGVIAILVLIFASLVLIGTLYTVRKVRRNRALARETLPTHHKHSHRRLTISASRASSIYVYDEKSSRPNSPTSPSSVPEIRITFPDEQDEAGKRTSGRVVVVRVGERGIGLEPLDEQLPAYEKESTARFQSIDIERIGGLKEKSSWA